MFWFFMMLVCLILWAITPEIIRNIIQLVLFGLFMIWLIKQTIKFFKLFGFVDGIKILFSVALVVAEVLLVLMLPIILIRLFIF